MKKNRIHALIVLTMVLASSAPALAQETDAQQKFIDLAINSDRFEIAMGKLATERSQNEAVKQFGQMLAQHHTKSTQELEKMLVERRLIAPKNMSDAHQSLQDAMQNLTDDDFDTTFKKVIIKSHQDAISFYEVAANGLQDEELRNWARNQIPVLKEHLEQAQQLDVGTTQR